VSFKLPPNQQLASETKWPFVGETEPRSSDEPWTVTIDGLVAESRSWTLEELLAMPQVEREIDVHCVTRWSKPAMRFCGISLASLLDVCELGEEAKYLSFVARSERSHSTSLPISDALELGTLVAFEANGEPLSSRHGGPVRTVVPGRYFYKSLKWLERIEVLENDRLGYWEAESGYHNVADPLREERYAAPNLDRGAVEKAMQARDFRGYDFRSLAADDYELEGLVASGTLLRDARFCRAKLRDANFDGANLSNAHLEDADLRGASFVRADLEGASFCGADLRGANLSGASLIATSFCEEDGTHGATFDTQTIVDDGSIAKLMPIQQAFVGRERG